VSFEMEEELINSDILFVW